MTERWRRNANSGLQRPDLHRLLVDETIRLLDPGTHVELAIPRPSTEDELADILFRFLGVRIPNVQVCEHHSTPWRAFADAYFARHPVSIWKGARGLAGKSYTLALLAWVEALTLRADVSILGGSGEQSERVHDYLRQFWMRPGAPAEALASDPSKKRTSLIWGNGITALLASQRSVRGPHPQRLRMDEIDAMDWTILEAALGQPMGRGDVDSQTVLSSTHQNADGPMTKALQMVADRGWSVHEWCWRETVEPHGWISQRAVERKRVEMTAESWRVEVELGEPSPENRAMLQEKVDVCFSGHGRTARTGEYVELEPPVEGAAYATGADWAKDVDFTEIVTFRADCNPMRLVAYERLQRRPMPEMVGRLDARIRRYPGEAAHDNTGGGNYLADWIEEPVEDVNLVGRSRGELFTNYIAAIEREELVAPRLEPLYSQHKYCTNDDLFGAGHPPDGVVASALAYKASFSARKPLRILTGDGTSRTATESSPNRDGLNRALTYLSRR